MRLGRRHFVVGLLLAGLAATAAWAALPAGGTPFPSSDDWRHALAWGDADCDGDLDLAIARYGNQSNEVWFNVDGVLDESTIWTTPHAHNSEGIAWADIDGDGDLDLVSPNLSAKDYVYENLDLCGGFDGTTLWESTATANSREVALADCDDDGDLDLAVSRYVGYTDVVIYRNDAGTLTSTPAWEATESEAAVALAWGDLDGDDALDLLVGRENVTDLVYPQPCFSPTTFSGGALDAGLLINTQGVAIGDIDATGTLDVVVVAREGPGYFHYNQGLGVFSSGEATLGDGYSKAVAFADWNGDGDLDAAVGNGDSPSGGNNRLYDYYEDGGNMAVQWTSSDVSPTYGVAWADVDGDSDPDLGAANASGATSPSSL